MSFSKVLAASNVHEVVSVDHLQIICLSQVLLTTLALDAGKVEGVLSPDQPLTLDVLSADLAFVPVKQIVTIHTQWLVIPEESQLEQGNARVTTAPCKCIIN